MRTISIRAEILAGSDLFEGVSDGIELAKKLEVAVTINFNGCELRLKPGDNAQDKCHEYRQWEAAGGLLRKTPKVIRV